MKISRIYLALALLPAIGSFSASALPLPAPVGPVQLSINLQDQVAEYELVSTSTNRTSTQTNITSNYKSTVSSGKVDAAGMLYLLSNSFNTNFPPGAKLVLRGSGADFGFFVADSTGTNLILNTSPILTISSDASVFSGSEKVTETFKGGTTTYSGNNTESYTAHFTISYNDNTFTTADGKHSIFQLSGVGSSKVSENIGTGKTSDTVNINLAGSGTFRDESSVILQGSLKVTLSGILVIL
ncbi:MAG: hypothetical protein U1F98_15545 [Verrucomicrobiota bacterium]